MSFAFGKLTNRTFLSVAGADATKFLQRFCTNDLSNVAEGQGCEAMFLNTKGKLVAFLDCFRLGDRWLLTGPSLQAGSLVEHLDRYILRDDVEFDDQSDAREFWLIVSDSESLPAPLNDLVGPLRAANAPLAATATDAITAIRTREFGNQGILLTSDSAGALDQVLSASGQPLDTEQIEAIQIESGYPRFGRDITENSLPQELQRDSEAINFNKGCYLGQETVARIDALGHVNRYVVRVTGGPAEITALPCPLYIDDVETGELTSWAVDRTSNSGIGIATVKRKFAEAGQQLYVQDGPTLKVNSAVPVE